MNHPNPTVKRKYIFFIITSLCRCVASLYENGKSAVLDTNFPEPRPCFCFIPTEVDNSTAHIEYTWSRNDKPFCRYKWNYTTDNLDLTYMNDDFNIDPNESNATSISIKNMTILHNGWYQCCQECALMKENERYGILPNNERSVNCESYEVMVFQIPNRQPEIDIIDIRKVNSSVFEIHANCTAGESYPAVSIEWSIGGQPLNADAIQSSAILEKVVPNHIDRMVIPIESIWPIGGQPWNFDAIQSSAIPEKDEPNQMMLMTNVSTLKTNISSEMFHGDSVSLRCTAVESFVYYNISRLVYNESTEIKIINAAAEGSMNNWWSNLTRLTWNLGVFYAVHLIQS